MNEESGGQREPSEEEMAAALEEELRKVRVQDLIMQSVASIVNLTARRIGKEDERDLEQARVGIDAVRALVGLLPEEAARQVKEALSQLQLLYAQAAGAAAGPGGGPAEGEGAAEPAEGEPRPAPQAPSSDQPRRGGEPPPRLWTPPGST